MKNAILAVCCLAALARAQHVEKVILLPDENAGISYPDVLCHNETEDQIYVSGWVSSGVVLLDAYGLRRVGRYETGYGVTNLAWSQGYNRVYSADFYDSTVTVYDAGAGQVIASIPGLDRPYRLLLDEPRDKLFVACDCELAVVDLAANTVEARIPIPADPIAMLADTARNRLLVTGSHDSLYFVDPYADSVIKVIPVGLPGLQPYQDLLTLDYTDQVLYVAGMNAQSVAKVCLLNDSITGTIPVPNSALSDLVWHPGRNLLYVSSPWPGLTVFDCATDSVIATLTGIYYAQDIELDSGLGRDRVLVCGATNEWGPGSHVLAVDCQTQLVEDSAVVGERLSQMCLIHEPDMLWVTDRDGSAVVALDGVTLEELARSSVGAKVSAVAWDSIDNRLYTANARTATVSVIDGTSLSVIDTIRVGYNPFALFWASGLNKLYVATQGPPFVEPPVDMRIAVIDCGSNQLIASLPGRGVHNHLAYSPTSNKVYCSVYSIGRSDSSVVIVIDGASNQVLTEVMTGPSTTRLLWYPDSNWMYCARYRSIAVIDCVTDNIIATIPDLAGPSEMVLSPTNNSIYVAHGSPLAPPFELLVIDAPTRTIRKRLTLNGWPYPVAWNSEKNEVYVGVVEEGEVCVVDCETDSIVATIATPGAGYLVDIVWNYVEDKLYCPDIITNTVYIIDVPTRQVTDMLPFRSWPLELAWDPVADRTFVPAWEGSNVTVLKGGPPAIAGPVETARARSKCQTIVRGALWLPRDMAGKIRGLPSGGGPASAMLLDVAGRKAMDLKPGANDVCHLAPGVYFVCAAGPALNHSVGETAVRKIVVQR
jgi:YVTN family beta-propeller protein